jgi:hypothetical protein
MRLPNGSSVYDTPLPCDEFVHLHWGGKAVPRATDGQYGVPAHAVKFPAVEKDRVANVVKAQGGSGPLWAVVPSYPLDRGERGPLLLSLSHHRNNSPVITTR